MVPVVDLAHLQSKDRQQIEALVARLEAAWQAAGPGPSIPSCLRPAILSAR